MTRQVPTDKPLSDEDREYLHARGEHARVEQMDEQFDVEDEDVDLEEEDVEEEDEEEGDKYDDWTPAQLSAECARRNLAKTGTKAQMIERLREHDASLA